MKYRLHSDYRNTNYEPLIWNIFFQVPIINKKIRVFFISGKKGHHKKGHYDDEHKGHKGKIIQSCNKSHYSSPNFITLFSYFRVFRQERP